MKPIILYEPNEINFVTNGIGVLNDATSAIVTEERNGIYELTMAYPITGRLFEALSNSCIIKCPVNNNSDYQLFRIYAITKPMNGIVIIHAEHISYQLSYTALAPFIATSAAEAMYKIGANIMTECPFTFWTDKETVGTYNQVTPDNVRIRLGGTAGSILDVYGGEYEFDNYTVKLHNNRGQNRNVTLRYGKNITDIEQEEKIEAVYTSIVGYWRSEDDVLKTGVINSEYVNNYPYNRTKVVDFSSSFNEKPTLEELTAKATAYMNANNFGIPNISIKVSFVALWQTEEYKNIAPLERVYLCDTVSVYFEKLNITAEAKVVKTQFNVLLEKYDSIELGNVRTNLSNRLAEQANEVQKALVESKSELEKAIDRATQLITGNNGGYVVTRMNAEGKPMELLIMDTDDVSTAQNVWRYNNAGWGYSSTGINGQYRLAATQDGHLVADFIDTGILTANIIKAGILGDVAGKNYWNMQTGEFSLAGGVTVGGQTVQQIADSAQSAAEATAANALANAVSIINSDIDDLQNQIDGNITTWFFPGVPTLNNAPANEWNTSTEKDAHLGDLYYDTNTEYAYRFMKTNDVYSWEHLSDSDISAALAVANQAQDTADHKRRIFITQPVPPYDVGDTWMSGANGDILTCINAKTTSQTYAASDWSKLNKYTDDSALTTFLTNTYANDKSAIQNQIDKKAETWYQDTDPSTSWTTSDLKAQHEGDLWYKTLNGENTTWYYQKSGNTYSWVQQNVPKGVFDEIDGKAQIYISQPTPPYNVCDLWFNSNNSDIMTCVTARATGNYNANDWQKRNKYTDDSALIAFVNGAYATFVTNTNTAIDGKITTFYQTSAPTTNVIGDLWIDTDNGNKLYRWDGSAWTSVQDTGIQSALNAASNAQTTADGKIVTFAQASQPTATDVGDLWIDTDDNNKMYRWSGNAWVAYTDTSALNTWLNNTYSSDKTNLQNQIDGKAETWYQSSDPSTSWTTEQKANHLGDLWYKTTDNTTWFYDYDSTTQTYSWKQQDVPNEVFDKIDGKCHVFVGTAHPVPPYNVGDLWFVNGQSDIWTCDNPKAAGEQYAGTDWRKKNKYIDSAAATQAAQTEINTYDTQLNQQKVFNKLTNNGETQGIYLQYVPNSQNPSTGSYKLFINAEYIATGVLADSAGKFSLNMNTGALQMKDGSFEGTITGSTIQTAEETTYDEEAEEEIINPRMVMDTSTSLKGYYGDELHNLINMEQEASGTHQMTIDADTRLNIRTPNLYVVNQSAGEETATVYKTLNRNSVSFVSNVEKDMDDPQCVEGNVKVGGVNVYCTLPVFLKVTKSSTNYKLGMRLSGESSTSVII